MNEANVLKGGTIIIDNDKPAGAARRYEPKSSQAGK